MHGRKLSADENALLTTLSLSLVTSRPNFEAAAHAIESINPDQENIDLWAIDEVLPTLKRAAFEKRDGGFFILDWAKAINDINESFEAETGDPDSLGAITARPLIL